LGELMFLLLCVPVGPVISTGLQPGVRIETHTGAASAAYFHWRKPLKRLSPVRNQPTGLKPGANEK
jgi:hypothetical protein